MKTTIYLSALALLSGCALQPPVKTEAAGLATVADRPAAASVDVGISWGWRVVGDAAARPVQVFDLNGQTYVQMRDRRPVVLLVNGEVVPHRTSWPYLVIQGQPDYIDVVLEGYRAVAERISAPAPHAAPIVASQEPVPQTNRVERVKIK